jgi:hypothetical protein
VGALLAVLVAGAAIAWMPSFSFAQLSPDPVVRALPDAPACPKCDIRVTKAVTLGAGNALLGVFSQAVARDRQGRYYVSSDHMSSVVVYAANGAELMEFGRDGSGPGEFRSILSIKVGPADSLYIGDMARRTSVFGPDGRYARSFNYLGDFSRAVLLPSGGFLAETRRGTLYEYCKDGKEEKQHGVTGGAERRVNPACRLCDQRVLAASRRWPGQFWSFVRNHYELERVDLSGAVRERFVRSVPWFEPWSAQAELVPLPRVSGVWEDPGGRVWVVIHVPDPSWTPASGPSQIKAAEDYNRMYDSVVEVLDPVSGRILVSKDLPDMMGLTDDGMLVSLRDAADGRVLADVWQPALVEATR